MKEVVESNSKFRNLRIGISGASGSLGKSLIKQLKDEGAVLIGLTHQTKEPKGTCFEDPDEWVKWSCGNERSLKETLSSLDILILNHGINPQGLQMPKNINESLEINALSNWKIMQIFEEVSFNNNVKKKELWINTSEAEIQIALSPIYEISKRLIGEIVSLRKNNLSLKEKELLTIRKLILGPFRSKLNPLGIMRSEYVAKSIVNKAKKEAFLIIVSPNPITHLLMPLIELARQMYSRITAKILANS